MRIVFMGTPDFAEESLRALLEAGEDVAAVFTQPDKPRGRGMRESFSPVKALAAERGIPVYQPITFKDGAATELLRTLAPELLVVVAYGRILPQAFLDVANTVGIIDSDYYYADNEGHIIIALMNMGDRELVIKAGERFAQGLFKQYFLAEEEDVVSKRTGGFGSTN